MIAVDKIVHINNKIRNIFNKILYFTLFISMISTVVFASGDDVGTVVDKLNSGEGVYGTIKEIMGILAWLGFAIAVFKLIQIGIMFMLGGGANKKDAKTALIPWLVGAAVCVLFGTVGPWIISIIMSGSSGDVFGI